MVWSQFSIVVQFWVHFVNSVLDNSSWDKISYSSTKKSPTCEEGGAHLRIIFCHLLTNFEKPEKSDFSKNEKNCWRYHHFTFVYQKPQSYEVQFLRYEVRENFLSFWAIFCPLNPLPPNNPENQNSEEMKKAFVDVIILNLCNKKHDHMMYGYSDMEFSRRQYFVISGRFLLFCPTIDCEDLNSQKCKKTPGDIILLHVCTISQDHMHPW